MTTTIDERDDLTAPGHTTGALGPSDSSDSGSDVQGSGPAPEGRLAPAGHLRGGASLDSDTDSAGTGDRAAADTEDAPVRDAADIDTDRVVDASDAGLGGGLDQAEEARLGVRDEDLVRDEDEDVGADARAMDHAVRGEDDDEGGLRAAAGGVIDEHIADPADDPSGPNRHLRQGAVDVGSGEDAGVLATWGRAMVAPVLGGGVGERSEQDARRREGLRPTVDPDRDERGDVRDPADRLIEAADDAQGRPSERREGRPLIGDAGDSQGRTPRASPVRGRRRASPV